MRCIPQLYVFKLPVLFRPVIKGLVLQPLHLNMPLPGLCSAWACSYSNKLSSMHVLIQESSIEGPECHLQETARRFSLQIEQVLQTNDDLRQQLRRCREDQVHAGLVSQRVHERLPSHACSGRSLLSKRHFTLSHLITLILGPQSILKLLLSKLLRQSASSLFTA